VTVDEKACFEHQANDELQSVVVDSEGEIGFLSIAVLYRSAAKSTFRMYTDGLDGKQHQI
jgi:hypothetical protein